MKKNKVLITGHGTIIDLVPAKDWHWGFSFRNWRIGFSIEESMWQFDFFCFYVWCDRYYAHGENLNHIPDGADITLDRRAVKDFNEFPERKK